MLASLQEGWGRGGLFFMVIDHNVNRIHLQVARKLEFAYSWLWRYRHVGGAMSPAKTLETWTAEKMPQI